MLPASPPPISARWSDTNLKSVSHTWAAQLCEWVVPWRSQQLCMRLWRPENPQTHHWLIRCHWFDIGDNGAGGCGLGRWWFMTRKYNDLQSAGICMFVAMTSRWISAGTKRRVLGCGLNSFPGKACSKITFAWWARGHDVLSESKRCSWTPLPFFLLTQHCSKSNRCLFRKGMLPYYMQTLLLKILF